MNKAFVILFFPFFFQTCSYSNIKEKKKNTSITKAFIRSVIPVVNELDNSVLNYSDSLTLFSMEAYGVLNFEEGVNFYNVDDTQISDTINPTKEEKYLSNFVYKKGNQYGLYFKFKSLTPAILPVDSFLSRHVPNFSFSSSSIDEHWKLLKTENGEKGTTETFITKVDTGVGSGSILELFYSKEYDNVNFILSKELDSIKKSRLYKTILNAKEAHDYVNNISYPRREIIIEIGKLSISEMEIRQNLDFIRIFDSTFVR